MVGVGKLIIEMMEFKHRRYPTMLEVQLQKTEIEFECYHTIEVYKTSPSNDSNSIINNKPLDVLF